MNNETSRNTYNKVDVTGIIMNGKVREFQSRPAPEDLQEKYDALNAAQFTDDYKKVLKSVKSGIKAKKLLSTFQD